MTMLLFDTALGGFGISWNAEGLTRLSLPHIGQPAAAHREEPTAGLPGFVVDVVARIRAYAQGARDDFADVPVALSGCDAFRRAIYLAARRLGHGETTTYGELAERAGFPRMARETGTALGRNPVPLVVPCHRILAAGNQPGGFSAPGGVATKLRLLSLEGVDLSPPPPAQASFAF